MKNINLYELIPMLIPVILLQLGLQVYSVVNLAKRKRVRFGNKFLWAIIIIFGEIIGAIVYLILNKGYEE